MRKLKRLLPFWLMKYTIYWISQGQSFVRPRNRIQISQFLIGNVGHVVSRNVNAERFKVFEEIEKWLFLMIISVMIISSWHVDKHRNQFYNRAICI